VVNHGLHRRNSRVCLLKYSKHSAGGEIERRRFERAPVTVGVSYSVLGDSRWQRAYAIDLSGGGICFWSVEQLAPGAEIAPRFRLPKTQRVILAQGRVLASMFDLKTNEYSHHVAFTKISESDQQAIVECVGKIARLAPAL